MVWACKKNGRKKRYIREWKKVGKNEIKTTTEKKWKDKAKRSEKRRGYN